MISKQLTGVLTTTAAFFVASISFAAVPALTVSGNQILSGGEEKSLAGSSFFWSNTEWEQEGWYKDEGSSIVTSGIPLAGWSASQLTSTEALVSPPPSAVTNLCEYEIINAWDTGFTALIRISNDSNAPINGWQVSWHYDTNSVTNSWNAIISGSYTATNTEWNGTILPGQSFEFGIQGSTNGGSTEVPTITGDVCSPVTASTSSSTTIASSSTSSVTSGSASTTTSSVSSLASSASSSTPMVCEEQCKWYEDEPRPLCETQTKGWGFEEGRSCIGRSTCESQWGDGGVISNCQPMSLPAISSTASTGASSTSISSQSSFAANSSFAAGRVDNPFENAQWYVDEVWSAKALAEPNGDKIAHQPSFVWMDSIGAIAPEDPSIWGLEDHLDAAVAQGANLFEFVIYNLPNRDCSLLSSNGELRISENGFSRYKDEYIAGIMDVISKPKFTGIRIVAIVEIGSLPNLISGHVYPDCEEAAGTGGYRDGIRYALNQLGTLDNVYSYVDISDSAWIGWTDSFSAMVRLVAGVVNNLTPGVHPVAGFASNSAQYIPVTEPYLPDSNLQLSGQPIRASDFYEWNPYFSELDFVIDWRNAMIQQGLPANIGMLIDTARNGWGGPDRPTQVSSSNDLNTYVDQSRIDRREHRSNWCNQAGGVGYRPQANPYAGIDAFVWVRPPGESDGVSTPDFAPDPNDPAKQYNPMCDPNGAHRYADVGTGAMTDAPHAGHWFSKAFQTLLQNAYPPL